MSAILTSIDHPVLQDALGGEVEFEELSEGALVQYSWKTGIRQHHASSRDMSAGKRNQGRAPSL
jgi:hypothetical protein